MGDRKSVWGDFHGLGPDDAKSGFTSERKSSECARKCQASCLRKTLRGDVAGITTFLAAETRFLLSTASGLSDLAQSMLRNLIFELSDHLLDESALSFRREALEFLQFCGKTRRRLFLLSTIETTPPAVAAYFERIYRGALDQEKALEKVVTENNLLLRETAFVTDRWDAIEVRRRRPLAWTPAFAGVTCKLQFVWVRSRKEGTQRHAGAGRHPGVGAAASPTSTR